MTSLTQNFTLEEMLDSQTAVRLGMDEQFSPADSIKQNLTDLCVCVLEPIRALIGSPIRISSGYRCERLNEAIGGASTSQHLKGQAADISCRDLTVEELYQKIKDSGIVCGQIINEFQHWVHVSYSSVGENKRECLRAVKVGGETKYIPYVAA